jgi:hypothetical protein
MTTRVTGATLLTCAATASGPDDPFADVNKRASAYGLTECGSSD